MLVEDALLDEACLVPWCLWLCLFLGWGLHWCRHIFLGLWLNELHFKWVLDLSVVVLADQFRRCPFRLSDLEEWMLGMNTFGLALLANIKVGAN